MLELDILTPQKKIAIEFDGMYWHSEEKQAVELPSKQDKSL